MPTPAIIFPKSEEFRDRCRHTDALRERLYNYIATQLGGGREAPTEDEVIGFIQSRRVPYDLLSGLVSIGRERFEGTPGMRFISEIFPPKVADLILNYGISLRNPIYVGNAEGAD